MIVMASSLGGQAIQSLLFRAKPPDQHPRDDREQNCVAEFWFGPESERLLMWIQLIQFST